MGSEPAKPQAAVKSFRDLEAWKACRKVRQSIFALAQKLPTQEKYRLADQLIRASRSATANLAEGYGRYHYRETIQFCRQARGSLYELRDHPTTARDCQYITEKSFAEQEKQALDAMRLVNGFVRYLRGRRAGVKTAG
ncbi:MAG: four helix bundle protein [Terriglobia bacterium]